MFDCTKANLPNFQYLTPQPFICNSVPKHFIIVIILKYQQVGGIYTVTKTLLSSERPAAQPGSISR